MVIFSNRSSCFSPRKVRYTVSLEPLEHNDNDWIVVKPRYMLLLLPAKAGLLVAMSGVG